MIAIQLNKADILNIQSQLNLKIEGIKELSSPKILEELANAVFTISANAFVKAMGIEAKGNSKAYHHIYEWNKLGSASGRLFFLYRESNANGSLVIKPGFIKSKTAVPISPELLSPGKTGKFVASRHIFRDKASVMESGRPIIYRASKAIPMADNGQIRFIAAGTIIKNYNPGGKQVKGSFEKFYNYWFTSKVSSVINSTHISSAIDAETAKVLSQENAGPAQVRTAIINLLKQYSRGEIVV